MNFLPPRSTTCVCSKIYKHNQLRITVGTFRQGYYGGLALLCMCGSIPYHSKRFQSPYIFPKWGPKNVINLETKWGQFKTPIRNWSNTYIGNFVAKWNITRSQKRKRFCNRPDTQVWNPLAIRQIYWSKWGFMDSQSPKTEITHRFAPTQARALFPANVIFELRTLNFRKKKFENGLKISKYVFSL